MNERGDVLIIGSGIGGLSCAIILLKLGYKVTVVEKNRESGGLMRSYRRFGISCPVGVHYIGSMDERQPLRRIFDYLGVTEKLPLERMGTAGPVDRYIFDDFSFDLPAGVQAFEDNLRTAFPAEEAAIDGIMKSLSKVSELMLSPSFPFNNTGISMMEMFRSMGELLAELNCSNALQNVLQVPCAWIGIPLSQCPVFYHHNALLSYLFSSWRLKTGCQDMADVFVNRVKELGGELVLKNGAKKILAENREVQGLLLESGRTLKAQTIVSAVHPKVMLSLLGEGAVRPAYENKVTHLEDTGSVFSVHLGVSAADHAELPYNIFRIKTEGGNVFRSRSLRFFQLRKSENPDSNLLTIITQADLDDWQPWGKTFTGNRGNDYSEKKRKLSQELIHEASGVFGPLKGTKVLDAYSPLTIRDWVNSPGGSAYGVLRSSDQLGRTASLSRTSVKGLHIAGQSAVAPGVLGAALGSLAAAREIVGNDFLKEDLFV